jgi:long-chain acyl-CoA synthetase
VPGKPEDLVEDDRVIGLIKPGIDALNKTLGNWESIKYFKLLPRPFTEEHGEITSTLKIKRRVINQKYADQIDSMYTRKGKPA